MTMKNKFLITISVLMVGLIAIAYLFFDKPEIEPLIEGYSKYYDVSLILDELKNQEYEEKFIEYQDKLEGAIKSYEEGGLLGEEKPNPDFFIEKARYAKYLGQIDWAIEILNNTFNYYENSSVVWNNLAKLYEEKGDYIKANEYYQIIIDTFSEKTYWSLYYYMSKNAILMESKEKVEEYYEKYVGFGGSSEEIESYLEVN